jgi:hypothetical protein
MIEAASEACGNMRLRDLARATRLWRGTGCDVWRRFRLATSSVLAVRGTRCCG